jgi:hypothetical protein
MNQAAVGPVMAVPAQGQFTQNEQYLFAKLSQVEGSVQQLESIATKLAENDYRLMSPGRMAVVVGGAVVGAAVIGFATAAIYDKVKYGSARLISFDELNALQSAAQTNQQDVR